MNQISINQLNIKKPLVILVFGFYIVFWSKFRIFELVIFAAPGRDLLVLIFLVLFCSTFRLLVILLYFSAIILVIYYRFGKCNLDGVIYV